MKTLPLGELDTIARSVRVAQTAAAYAGVLTHGDPDEAQRQAKAAKEACGAAINRLSALGATIPGVEDAPTPAAFQVPLQLLDTPATRELLAALEAAAVAGAKVDRERCWVDADGDPTGYGETFAGEALALRTSIFGPADLRQE